MMNENAVVKEADRMIDAIRKVNVSIRVVDSAGRPVADTAVKVRQTRSDFLFGCNIYLLDRLMSRRTNDIYKERFSELFNYATTGFYWKGYEPVRGRPDYAYTGKVIEWCEKHRIRLKGHPLLWEYEAGVPTWSKGIPSRSLQKKRVRDIMRRFGKHIEFWEVVNEPSHLAGISIDQPYRWAREACPAGYLIVNDYHVLHDGFPPFHRLLKDSIANGVPFDGIGIQAHEPLFKRFPLEDVKRYLDLYAKFGKELHITEFTPTSGGQTITGSRAGRVWTESEQADYAVKFYKVCYAHPSVVAITWWDLLDGKCWQKGGGLLRKDLSPKPAYHALKRLILEEWRTSTQGHADRRGEFTFRGFPGEYEIRCGEGRS
jgi:GH35 family endo-1,4-beta-xylanase